MGTQRLLSQRGTAPPPQFLAYICCRKMAGWIKMPFGREVGLGQSDIVLDGDPAPLPRKRAEPPIFGHTPIFGPCLLWPNGWMDQDATWCEGRPRPRSHCVTWGPRLPPPLKGHSPQIFGRCLLWPNDGPS